MQEIKSEITNFVASNKIIVVDSQEDLSKATTRIKQIKEMMKKIKASFDPIIDNFHKGHKNAIEERDKFLDPLENMEDQYKEAILSYNKKMEQEQNERIRLANERMAKEAEAEKQRLLAESQKTEDAWDKEELKEKAQAIVPVTCDTPKKAIEQDGLSIRKTWKARVIDINLVPKEYLIIEANMSALNQHARTNREVSIPGVTFYEESSVASR